MLQKTTHDLLFFLKIVHSLSLSSQVITSISLTHSLLEEGAVFIALSGQNYRYDHFFEEVLSKKVSLILYDSKEVLTDQYLIYNHIIPVENLKYHSSMILNWFYEYPFQSLYGIGITGTNGKTSIAYWITFLSHQLHLNAYYSGTLGHGSQLNKLQDLGLTTRSLDIVLKEANHFLTNQQGQIFSIEMSSHALQQQRLLGVKFEVAIFSNLTQDHLDYHQSMEAYFEAKKKLFIEYDAKNILLNIDDRYGKRLYDTLIQESHLNVLSYGKDADLSFKIVEKTHTSSQVKLITPWGEGELELDGFGEFQIYNLLSAIGSLCCYGVDFFEILKFLHVLPCVPGRMESLVLKTGAIVIIDYAHTPDAFSAVLSSARSVCSHRIYTVFGCGGGRDTSKRAEMGKIASLFSDSIILTNDNPRNEAPELIVKSILEGVMNKESVTIKYDRKDAIMSALSLAEEGDMLLILGKGHELYQEIKGKKIPFSDEKVVLEFMESIE